MLDKSARGKKCEAIEGLAKEADEIIKEAADRLPCAMPAC